MPKTEDDAQAIVQAAADEIADIVNKVIAAGITPLGVQAIIETVAFSSFIALGQHGNWRLPYALDEVDALAKNVKDRLRLATLPAEGNA